MTHIISLNNFNNLLLYRFINKFYCFNLHEIPYLEKIHVEFHNLKNNNPKQYLLMFSFLDEFLGFRPFLVNKGFNYNHEGKKIFMQDIKTFATGNALIDLLKFFYVAMSNRRIRFKLIKNINKNSLGITALCSDFTLPLYRELFLSLDTFNLNLKFSVNNRFILSYFFKIFNFF